jgi:hypothetical protein
VKRVEKQRIRTSSLLIAVPIALCIYILSYYAIVKAKPSGIFRIGPGPFPKTAVYPIAGEEFHLGKVRTYELDAFTHPFFTPINAIDHRLRPSVWEE